MSQRNMLALPAASIPVAASKVFTYPTRLADCFTPAVQEIYLPGYQITRPKIEIAVKEGRIGALGRKRQINLTTRYKLLLKSVYKNLLPPIQMNNEYFFDSRYEADGNIAHVLDNIVPAVLMVRLAFPSIVVILRAKATAMAKTVFNLLQIPIICTDSDVIGKSVLVNQAGEDWFSGDGRYPSLYDTVSFDGYKRNTPKRIFVSRKGARSLLNEAEVEQVLKQHSFEKVYFEDVPVCEQWSLARNAKAVVGVHGAALISLLFNRNAVKVVELFHPGYVVNLYRHLTNAVGGTWCGVTGKLPPDIVKRLDYQQQGRYFALDPTEIDMASLRMALTDIGIE